MYVMQWFICVTMRGRYALQADTSKTSLMREHNKSAEILSAAAQLYEKSHLTRRIALSCGIKISPVGSLD